MKKIAHSISHICYICKTVPRSNYFIWKGLKEHLDLALALYSVRFDADDWKIVKKRIIFGKHLLL